jgi:hypothetical protein
MQHFRYTEDEITELCKIPPWTESALDKHAKQIHTRVPITRKCLVNQCLFWCDVAQRFKRNLHGRRKPQPSEPFDTQGGDFVVGVIGCGSVGSKFVRELIQRRIVEPCQIRISSRTPSRAKQRCGIDAVASNAEVASHSTILFLFVLPFHFRTFSREIRDTIQRVKPLIISTLAGYTQVYLQRALNTRFLITTSVDLPTVNIAAERVSYEFPFACFATGEELSAFQEFFSGSDTPVEAGPDETGESRDAEDATPMMDDMLYDPFHLNVSDDKELRHLHQAAFAAENLANCGIGNINDLIVALRDWVSTDSNHSKIEVRPETYRRLWAVSFIPLSCIARLQAVQERALPGHEKPLRFLLKRVFVRSLVPQIGHTGESSARSGAAPGRATKPSDRR